MKAKELSNEELAVIIRCIRVTGIAATLFEKECLDEAADRLDLFALVKIWKENETC